MSHCQNVALADRAVIGIAGADATKFLQGLITNDMSRTAEGRGLYGALLSPQGKILFDFFVVGDGHGGYLMDCRADQAEALAKRLMLYRLRADVAIEPKDGLCVAAVLGEAPTLPDGAIGFSDPRLAALGLRVIGPHAIWDELGCQPGAQADYDDLRIRLGVPEGGLDFAYGNAFPHEALFDQLNGVDFKKGCFVGQEVVSRMEHRGTARKRIVPVSADRDLPESGTEVTAGDTPLGALGSVSGRHGLALLRLDRAEQALAEGKPVCAGGIALCLEQPTWAHFTVPAATGSQA